MSDSIQRGHIAYERSLERREALIGIEGCFLILGGFLGGFSPFRGVFGEQLGSFIPLFLILLIVTPCPYLL